MASWKLPPLLLPDGELRDLWVDGSIISDTSSDAAPDLPGKYACPGLVDAHIHLALRDFKPLGLVEALDNLRAARDSGVLNGSRHGGTAERYARHPS